MMRTLVNFVAFGLATLVACSGDTGDGRPGSAEDQEERREDGPSDDRGPVATDPPATGPCRDPMRDPGPVVARRLTRWEYVNAVRDTLGVDLAEEAERWPQELHTDGFYNTAKDLRPSLERVTVFETLARQAVAKLDARFVDRFTSCRSFGDRCEDEFVDRLGLRLARRPLDAEEVAGFRKLFAIVKDCGQGFDEAARVVVEALLQSPQFLYRSERQALPGDGPFRALDGYELATRLAFLVTGSSPDDELLAAAKDGRLRDADERAQQARRLLDRPGARAAALRFVNDWLTLDELDGTVRDNQRFPQWNDALRAEGKQEALDMAEDVLWDRGLGLAALLTHEETTATPGLAKLYGWTAKGDGWRGYEMAADPRRRGILTTAGVLMRSGGNADATMVTRALFVFRGLMCLEVGSPSANVDTSTPKELQDGSKRDFAEYRTSSPTCGGCHQHFDPLAYVFEPYDGIGVYRDEDDKGHATRTDGVVTDPADPQPYRDLDEYVSILSASAAVRTCLVRKPFQFAIGRALESLDECTIGDLERALAQGNGSYGDLLVAIARHPVFAYVRRE